MAKSVRGCPPWTCARTRSCFEGRRQEKPTVVSLPPAPPLSRPGADGDDAAKAE